MSTVTRRDDTRNHGLSSVPRSASATTTTAASWNSRRSSDDPRHRAEPSPETTPLALTLAPIVAAIMVAVIAFTA